MTVNRLTCLWPGLARLWFRGEWLGLLTACAYAALVNMLIVTTLLWTEVAPEYLRWAGWIVAIFWWLVAACLSLRDLPNLTSGEPHEVNQGLFAAAQTEYLKGNWIEAEACVRKLLRRAPRDVESLLLLATIQRRTRRHDEARVQLQQIARLDAANRWQVELRKERQMLRRETQREKVEQHQETASPFNTPTINPEEPDTHETNQTISMAASSVPVESSDSAEMPDNEQPTRDAA